MFQFRLDYSMAYLLFLIPFLAEEIVYQDSTDNALSQVDLLTREIYLPLLCSEQGHASSYGMSADKLMDLLHRLMGGVEVTQGHAQVRCFNVYFSRKKCN